MDDQRFVPISAETEKQLPPETTLGGRLSRFALKRFPVWSIFDFMAKKKVPRHRHSVWYMMGGIVLFFFLIQLVTGVLLMFYYRPAQPWASVQRIVMEIPYGNLIRSIHHWSANLMVLSLFMHLFSTFFMKAYRPPRELTWVTGLFLLGLTLLFSFSGYLLPWDPLAFFATRVGITEMEKIPVLGAWLANLARGGPNVTLETLGRFYVLHVLVLPLTVLLLVSVHLLFVQLQGVSETDTFRQLPPKKKRYHKFFSEFLLGEIPLWLGLIALLVALAAFFPRELSPEVDPFSPAPKGIKPEWYFLSQFQLLKLFPGYLEMVGVLGMGLLPLFVLLLPFYDKEVPADERGRKVTRWGLVALLGLIIFTLWGWLS